MIFQHLICEKLTKRLPLGLNTRPRGKARPPLPVETKAETNVPCKLPDFPV